MLSIYPIIKIERKEKKIKSKQKKIIRKKKSIFPKNQKPKTKKNTRTINPADDRIFYSLQILFFRQTKYNTETRNSENNSNNNKKQKKREKTKRSKEFKTELKKKGRRERNF